LTPRPRVLGFGELSEGMSVAVPFTVSQADMEAFLALSGDASRIHLDADFARSCGFAGPVVYGALIVARLSNLVGMHIPGDLGLATSWKIDFHRPLYVNDNAVMHAEITHVSPATHTVKLKFHVMVGERLIATGTAGSKLLDEPAESS
jgi:3-hydroxybutyryl-CoA dehydratase